MAKPNKNFMSIAEIAKELGCGKTKAWQVKTLLNKELEAKGYTIIFPGMVSRKYFRERVLME